MNPYAIIGALALALGLAGGGYYQGWEKRGDHEAAITLKAKLATDKLLAAEAARADRLAGELAAEQRNIKTVTIEVVKEIPTVTTVYIEKAGDAPIPIPRSVITFGAVRLYNRALRPDLPAGAGEFAYPPGATDLARARVDTPDILAVHALNAGKYADCRSQLNKLIDFELGKDVQP